MKKLNYMLVIFFIVSSLVPAIAQNQFEVMVYTSPDRWHNATIPTAINEFEEMALRHQFGLTWTQQASSFDHENLKKYDVIVFLHSNGEQLSGEQRESFKRFIRNGGGFVGIHAASVNASQEEWYRKLVGRVFTGHPEVQTAILTVHDKNFPATMHLPDKWIWTDEWYSFEEALTENQHVLITVDESTYDPYKAFGKKKFEGMGEFHPIAWYQEYDGGRSFFTALGHMEALYKDPWFLMHIYGGIYWAATGKGINK
jgi:type 1 glutamine amidotransferase